MSFSIRLAGPSDAPLLGQIEHDAGQLFRDAPGLEWLAEGDAADGGAYHDAISRGLVWIAGQGDVDTGFVAAKISGDELHILELSVARAWQRRGIARALIAAATERARALGLTALTLTTFRDLPWNAPFYARAGFVVVGETELSERLSGEIDRDAAAGLPRERRCAMRLAV